MYRFCTDMAGREPGWSATVSSAPGGRATSGSPANRSHSRALPPFWGCFLLWPEGEKCGSGRSARQCGGCRRDTCDPACGSLRRVPIAGRHPCLGVQQGLVEHSSGSWVDLKSFKSRVAASEEAARSAETWENRTGIYGSSASCSAFIIPAWLSPT